MFKKLLLAAAVLVTGCAGSFDGKVGGESMTVKDTVFLPVKNGDSVIGVSVVMTDQPDTCDLLKANREPKASKWVQLQLYEVNDAVFLYPEKGDFSVGSALTLGNGKHAYGTFHVRDENCNDKAASADSKSGLVKVTNLEPKANGTLNSTWDITFGEDQVKGSFNATFCDVDWTQVNLHCE
jgi:hypothetical protein